MPSERFHCCKRIELASRADSPPFALPGAGSTFVPARAVDVRHLRIEVALAFAAASVAGTTTLTLAALNDGPARVTLDAVELHIESVTFGDGKAVAFGYDGAKLSFEAGERRE